MPVLSRDHDAGQAVRLGEEHLGLSDGLLQRLLLDDLPLAIQSVELTRDPGGLDRIEEGEKSRAEPGVADAAAGVDPRPEREAEVIGARRPIHSGDVHQRR